jgi:hypothetical protein
VTEQNLSSISSNCFKPEPDEKQVEAAWRKFLSAWDRAERTKAVTDGIAAGHAKRDFLDLFCPTAGRPQ